MTTVGELFVGLGVKGSEKSVGAITGVKDNLGKTKDMALETKAAIIGAVFAFERMFASSLNTGSQLSKFTTLTGETSQELERYQWAAQQVNVANDSVTKSFVSLQDQMTKVFFTGKGPEGMSTVFSELGLGPEKIKAFMDAPDKLILQLQKWAQMHKKDPAYVRKILSSFGLDNEFVVSLMKNAYRPDVLSKAPVHSQKDVESLASSNAALANMGTKFEFAMDRVAAKHLPALLKDLDPLISKLAKVIDSFSTMAEKLKLLKVAGLIFEGWAKIFEDTSQVIDYLNEEMDQSAKNNPENKPDPRTHATLPSVGPVESDYDARKKALAKGLNPDAVMKEYWDALASKPGVKAKREEREQGLMDFFKKMVGAAPSAPIPIGSDVPGKTESAPAAGTGLQPVNPAPKVTPIHTSSNTKTMNFHQINNVHGAANSDAARGVANASQKAVKDAFLNMPSRAQGA